jgi:hypothetical protein
MTATAFHLARFEQDCTPLYRCDNNPRFLRRRPRNGWRRRDRRSLTAQSDRCERASLRSELRLLLKEGLEVSLFATYFVVFLGSLWLLG